MCCGRLIQDEEQLPPPPKVYHEAWWQCPSLLGRKLKTSGIQLLPARGPNTQKSNVSKRLKASQSRNKHFCESSISTMTSRSFRRFVCRCSKFQELSFKYTFEGFWWNFMNRQYITLIEFSRFLCGLLRWWVVQLKAHFLLYFMELLTPLARGQSLIRFETGNELESWNPLSILRNCMSSFILFIVEPPQRNVFSFSRSWCERRGHWELPSSSCGHSPFRHSKQAGTSMIYKRNKELSLRALFWDYAGFNTYCNNSIRKTKISTLRLFAENSTLN